MRQLGPDRCDEESRSGEQEEGGQIHIAQRIGHDARTPAIGDIADCAGQADGDAETGSRRDGLVDRLAAQRHQGDAKHPAANPHHRRHDADQTAQPGPRRAAGQFVAQFPVQASEEELQRQQ